MLQWMGSEDGDDTAGTILRDIILFCFGVVAAVLLIILPHINEPESKEDVAQRRGNMRVEILWDDERNVDVDLWCLAPGDVPVGYSNVGGTYFNLLRDDLGHINDATGMNYEISYTRGLPAGEYVINLHYYRGDGAAGPSNHPADRGQQITQPTKPIKVKILITIKKDDSGSSKTSPQKILTTEIELMHQGDEITVARFRLDKNKDLIEGSINNVQMNLRSITAP